MYVINRHHEVLCFAVLAVICHIFFSFVAFRVSDTFAFQSRKVSIFLLNLFSSAAFSMITAHHPCCNQMLLFLSLVAAALTCLSFSNFVDKKQCCLKVLLWPKIPQFKGGFQLFCTIYIYYPNQPLSILNFLELIID